MRKVIGWGILIFLGLSLFSIIVFNFASKFSILHSILIASAIGIGSTFFAFAIKFAIDLIIR